MPYSRRFLALCLALPLAGCGDPEVILSCESIGDATPLCGWQNPEDLTALPDDRFVLVSEYGGMSELPGQLSLLDRDTAGRHVLYDGDGTAGEADWGDSSCPGQVGAAFSPHGIHLRARQDGALQLTAVQHGERESLEFFEVIEEPEGVTLIWRGCAVGPEDSTLNDVAVAEDGTVYVSHMMEDRGAVGQTITFLKAQRGGDTGHVYRWRQGEGFQVQAGTEGPIPNGVQLAPDDGSLFVNYSGEGEVREVDLGSGEIVRTIATRPLDNSTWAPDGRLLVAAAMEDAWDMMGCSEPEEGTCPGEFAILAVDVETGDVDELYRGGPTTPSGHGTVGLQLEDGTLLTGTFAGDRIVVVDPAGLE